MRASQAWSIDILLGVIIFIGAAFFFYSAFSHKQEDNPKMLEEDASNVMKIIVSQDSEIGIITGTEVDISRLQGLLGKDYSEIKNKLRVGSDFCIFLEDENGNIIYITPSQPGIGTDKIKISDAPCS